MAIRPLFGGKPRQPKLLGITPYNPASGQSPKAYLAGLGGTLTNTGGQWSLAAPKPSGVAAAQPAPAAPGVAPVPAAAAPAAGQPQAATDARYTSDAAKLLFGNTNQISDLQQAQQYANADYGESTRRLAEQRVQALQNADETANSQGLFYSGILGKRRGQLETNYSRQLGDMRDNYERSTLQRNTAIDRIGRGQTLDLEGLKLDALDRIAIARANAPAPDPNAVPQIQPGQSAKAFLGPANLGGQLTNRGGQWGIMQNGKFRRIVGGSLV